MESARSLLPYFLHVYPFQPATGVWRSAEIAALLEHGLPEGVGLDVGCGDGLLTGIINERLEGSRTWVGIDPDPEEIALASETGLYSECIATGGGTLPFSDDSFDFALSNSVLEHIPVLDPVLKEVARVLKKDGHFLFTVPSSQFHSALHGPLLPFGGRSNYLATVDKRCAHIRYWSEDDWRTALDRSGLSVVAAKPYLSKTETQRWETCSRLTGGLLYSLFGRSQQPIEIQRRLGMRRKGMRLPMPLARIAAWLLSVTDGQRPEPPFGCLLVDAVKV